MFNGKSHGVKVPPIHNLTAHHEISWGTIIWRVLVFSLSHQLTWRRRAFWTLMQLATRVAVQIRVFEILLWNCHAIKGEPMSTFTVYYYTSAFSFLQYHIWKVGNVIMRSLYHWSHFHRWWRILDPLMTSQTGTALFTNTSDHRAPQKEVAWQGNICLHRMRKLMLTLSLSMLEISQHAVGLTGHCGRWVMKTTWVPMKIHEKEVLLIVPAGHSEMWWRSSLIQ